jgi:hypothetical protein
MKEGCHVLTRQYGDLIYLLLVLLFYSLEIAMPTNTDSPPCNDTCGECTVFQNAFHYRESRKNQEQEEDYDMSSNTGSDSEDEHECVDVGYGQEYDADDAGLDNELVVDNLAKSVLGYECIDQERILEATVLNVSQAKAEND